MVEISMKKCDTCHQILPVNFFNPSIQLLSGYQNACAECTAQYKRVMKPDECDRKLERHNMKIVTTAWAQLPYNGIGYDIDFKVDITWTLEFRKRDVALCIFDSKGQMMSCSAWKKTIPLKQRLQLIVDFLQALSVRLELSPFDREMSKRTIYIY